MTERKRGSEPNKRIFDQTDPKHVWGPTLRVQREWGELTLDEKRALDLRRLCLRVTETIFNLHEDPDIKRVILMEADALRIFHQGIAKIRALGVIPYAHTEDDELDTPLKLAEYVAGQLLLVDGNNIDNIYRTKNPSPVGFAVMVNWYLYDTSPKIGEEKQELPLEEEAVWVNSNRLWDTISEVVLNDSYFKRRMPKDYLWQIVQEDIRLDDKFQIKRPYFKKNGKGSFMLRVGTGGFEVEEWDEDDEYLGSALIAGPGKTDGFIGFTDKLDRNHVNTDFALTEADRVVAAFIENLR